MHDVNDHYTQGPSPSKMNEESKPYISEQCIFVANLPHQYTNEQLASSLYENFINFGKIISLKTSRDYKGRPFGFIEFSNKDEAQYAIQGSSYIKICSRQIRVELAKCQRKIQIILNDASLNVEEVKKEIVYILSDHAIPTSSYVFRKIASPNLLIVKFYHSKDSFSAYNAISDSFKCKYKDSVEVDWISAKNFVPYIEKVLCEVEHHRQDSQDQHARAAYPNYRHYSHAPQQYARSYTDLQYSPQAAQANDVAGEVFIGRLNPWEVSEDRLKEELRFYGTLIKVQLVNKRCISYDGVVQDAFAFVRYANDAESRLCIENLNGKVLFGQAVKCSWAKSRPAQHWSTQCQQPALFVPFFMEFAPAPAVYGAVTEPVFG